MDTPFRFPERLGAFSLWIAPEVYPLAESARLAGEAHRALVQERTRQTLPGSYVPDLGQDEEFLASATDFFRQLEELWEGLERQQTLTSVRHLPQVRRLFLASAVEWALDLHYEVREVTQGHSNEATRWRVIGRAWDGDRFFDFETTSVPFPEHRQAAGELALIEALSRAYTGAIGGLIGWVALDAEMEPGLGAPPAGP
jgi:hypothetical protein